MIFVLRAFTKHSTKVLYIVSSSVDLNQHSYLNYPLGTSAEKIKSWIKEPQYIYAKAAVNKCIFLYLFIILYILIRN